MFNLCEHGYFDMQAHSDFSNDKLHDQACDESELATAPTGLRSAD